MNYLAHAYLSFGNPDILLGNMISDFIKGKKKFDFPVHIQAGITLHRKIDAYTDEHPATRQAKELLKDAAGPYAGSFVDIVYDHFLALDEYEFENEGLSAFTQETYRQIEKLENWIPEKNLPFFFYMRTQDWLFNYQFTEGIRRSFEGLCRRAKYIHDAKPVFEAFIKNYDALKNAYELFFPHLKTFAYHELLYLRES